MIVVLDKGLQLRFAEISRGGGAMQMQDARTGAIHAGPAALPRAHAQVEVFDVGWIVDLIEPAELGQLGGIENGASAAAVENVALVLAFQRVVAADREIGEAARGRDDRLAGLFAAAAFGEETLRGGGEQAGNPFESLAQSRQESRLGEHVVIQHTDMRKTRAPNAAIDGVCERQRLRAWSTMTDGKSAWSASTVPSSDPLSTTIISSAS